MICQLTQLTSSRKKYRRVPGLFDPLKMGSLALPNRMLMAPMTRGRARADGVPNPNMIEYYEQRSDAGLIVTEATCISPMGRGWCNAPSIYTQSQQDTWKLVTAAVKRRGGRIQCQLWHLGRVSHPDFLEGRIPLAPSAIRPNQESHTYQGKKPCVTPQEMSIAEIQSTIHDYALAATRAIAAGFNGVQIHAASGYLPDQFLRSGTNSRSDEYGGTARNRSRFLHDIVAACCRAIGEERISVRMSPRNPYNDMFDSDPIRTFETAAGELARFKLAFVEVVEAIPGHFMAGEGEPVLPAIRAAYPGVVVVNGGYTRALADQAIGSGLVDAVSFGIPFLSNPDAVERLRNNSPLNAPEYSTFYSTGEPGYLDYPTLRETGGAAKGEYRALSLDEAKRH